MLNTEMFSLRVRLLIFLVAFPLVVKRSSAQRSQADPNLRGHSFGLENFLFQRFETTEPIRITTPKRGRPMLQGQTYGLENLSTHVYESSRIVPTPEKRRPAVEPIAESSRVKENLVQKAEPATPEVVTERIRKRIMMKRRRKRPSNLIRGEEVTGNAILKPVRIPVFPQVPKVVIRRKLQETSQRPVKPVLEEEVTQQDVTTEIERITTTTMTTTMTTTTEKPSTINLKTFLKQQTETLSLSELLQTQNLSLADLLKGNKDASVILKARQTTTTTTSTVSRKAFNKPEISEPEYPKRFEVLEVTTSRPTYNRFHPKIPKIKPPEPSIPKPENIPKDSDSEESQRPGKRPNGMDPLYRLNEMRLKLRNFQRKTTPLETLTREETTEPVTRVTETPVTKKNRVSFQSTNNPELSLILPVKPKPELETYKRPEKLVTWTNRLPPIKRLGQERIKPEETEHKLLKTSAVEEEVAGSSEEPEESKTTEIPVLEDVRKPEPKDELIELLKSGQNADRLQKILNSRNMTLQELLDNREKPPLQMDITTLFSSHHLRERSSPAPTLFESLPDFDLKPEESYDEPYAEESAPTIARVELVPPFREPKLFNVDPNLQLDNLKMDPTNSKHPALWRLTEKSSMYHGNLHGFGQVFAAEPEPQEPSVKTPELTDSDIILLETIRRNQETNRKYKLDFSDFVKEEEPPEAENIEKSYIPPAVKSAIIASGVVMGIALFVFIAIFAACGWKQRRIRLKGSSFADSLSEPSAKSKRTLSPVSYSVKSYKKTIDFDDETSESGTSNTSSYLWSTLKNTFTSRTSTVKGRLEREEKMREDKTTLRRNESTRKGEIRSDDEDEERFPVKKINRDRNVISKSFNFKRTPSTRSINHYDGCVHGY